MTMKSGYYQQTAQALGNDMCEHIIHKIDAIGNISKFGNRLAVSIEGSGLKNSNGWNYVEVINYGGVPS